MCKCGGFIVGRVKEVKGTYEKFIEIIVVAILFLITKVLVVGICKVINKTLKTEEKEHEFDFGISIIMQLFFISVWSACIGGALQVLDLTNLEIYISLCLVGAFCVFWCYFSWDAQHIFVKPDWALAEERRVKKIVVYSLVLLFALCQGYQQTLHATDSSFEVNLLFSLTNYSIIVATIALDRVMNQICTK